MPCVVVGLELTAPRFAYKMVVKCLGVFPYLYNKSKVSSRKLIYKKYFQKISKKYEKNACKIFHTGV